MNKSQQKSLQKPQVLIHLQKAHANEMDLIDFSEIENSEKFLRDNQSKDLNNCIGKYVNRRVKPLLGDVSELMYSKVEDCDNIFDATRSRKFQRLF